MSAPSVSAGMLSAMMLLRPTDQYSFCADAVAAAWDDALVELDAKRGSDSAHRARGVTIAASIGAQLYQLLPDAQPLPERRHITDVEFEHGSDFGLVVVFVAGHVSPDELSVWAGPHSATRWIPPTGLSLEDPGRHLIYAVMRADGVSIPDAVAAATLLS